MERDRRTGNQISKRLIQKASQCLKPIGKFKVVMICLLQQVQCSPRFADSDHDHASR